MRDLKHLIYFENLLQTANNELIEKAKKKGGIAVAYTCENVPEPLLNLGKCFSIRLHAPQTGSMDIAAFYMTNLLCEPSRALLERAIEGGFNFADCVITPDGCTMMNRAVENMELLKTMGKDNPNFFHEYMEIAFKNTGSLRAAVHEPHPHSAQGALRRRRLRQGHPQGRGEAQQDGPRHPRDRRISQGRAAHHGL